MPNIRKKLMCKFQEHLTSGHTGQAEEWTGRQTLIYRNLLAMAGGSNKTFAYIYQRLNHYISESFFVKT